MDIDSSTTATTANHRYSHPSESVDWGNLMPSQAENAGRRTSVVTQLKSDRLQLSSPPSSASQRPKAIFTGVVAEKDHNRPQQRSAPRHPSDNVDWERMITEPVERKKMDGLPHNGSGVTATVSSTTVPIGNNGSLPPQHLLPPGTYSDKEVQAAFTRLGTTTRTAATTATTTTTPVIKLTTKGATSAPKSILPVGFIRGSAGLTHDKLPEQVVKFIKPNQASRIIYEENRWLSSAIRTSGEILDNVFSQAGMPEIGKYMYFACNQRDKCAHILDDWDHDGIFYSKFWKMLLADSQDRLKGIERFSIVCFLAIISSFIHRQQKRGVGPFHEVSKFECSGLNRSNPTDAAGGSGSKSHPYSESLSIANTELMIKETKLMIRYYRDTESDEAVDYPNSYRPSAYSMHCCEAHPINTYMGRLHSKCTLLLRTKEENVERLSCDPVFCVPAQLINYTVSTVASLDPLVKVEKSELDTPIFDSTYPLIEPSSVPFEWRIESFDLSQFIFYSGTTGNHRLHDCLPVGFAEYASGYVKKMEFLSSAYTLPNSGSKDVSTPVPSVLPRLDKAGLSRLAEERRRQPSTPFAKPTTANLLPSNNILDRTQPKTMTRKRKEMDGGELADSGHSKRNPYKPRESKKTGAKTSKRAKLNPPSNEQDGHCSYTKSCPYSYAKSIPHSRTCIHYASTQSPSEFLRNSVSDNGSFSTLNGDVTDDLMNGGISHQFGSHSHHHHPGHHHHQGPPLIDNMPQSEPNGDYLLSNGPPNVGIFSGLGLTFPREMTPETTMRDEEAMEDAEMYNNNTDGDSDNGGEDDNYEDEQDNGLQGEDPDSRLAMSKSGSKTGGKPKPKSADNKVACVTCGEKYSRAKRHGQCGYCGTTCADNKPASKNPSVLQQHPLYQLNTPDSEGFITFLRTILGPEVSESDFIEARDFLITMPRTRNIDIESCFGCREGTKYCCQCILDVRFDPMHIFIGLMRAQSNGKLKRRLSYMCSIGCLRAIRAGAGGSRIPSEKKRRPKRNRKSSSDSMEMANDGDDNEEGSYPGFQEGDSTVTDPSNGMEVDTLRRRKSQQSLEERKKSPAYLRDVFQIEHPDLPDVLVRFNLKNIRALEMKEARENGSLMM